MFFNGMLPNYHSKISFLKNNLEFPRFTKNLESQANSKNLFECLIGGKGERGGKGR